MQIYNSLSHSKQEFIPVRPGVVNIYVCGITAYDFCHIGHARSAIVFDVLVRHLRRLGYKVLFVRNFTDIDDKIIKRAREENRDWREVGETYINEFHSDMDKLGVMRADLEPRATDYIPQIIKICEKLIDSGNAYPSKSGDVYFRVDSFANYGKLSGRSTDELMAGARVAIGEEKENPLDFALWKAAKPGEPCWESPWGKGRPGWHIECSAMSQPFLPLDIHGGGQDLAFPHHENEIAQSESLCGCHLAKYWVHNGFVQINDEKMSKSLGNFTTIRDILTNFLPETLRFFLLAKHYRSPIDFTEQGMEEAERALQRVYKTLLDAEKALKNNTCKTTAFPADLREEWINLDKSFKSALDDDINTAGALGHIFAQTRIVNRLLEEKEYRKSKKTAELLDEFLARCHDWQEELGIFTQNPQSFLYSLRKIRARRKNLDMNDVEKLLAARKEARSNKNFSLADELRKRLSAMGVVVQDTPEGQTWDID